MRLIVLVLYFACLLADIILAQQSIAVLDDRPVSRCMFYNVENLFDVSDDTLTWDDDFTPEGVRRWNNSRYREKIISISKVIIGVGAWELPILVGLCEIENRQVLEDLIWHTPLQGSSYRIIQYESPDRRGIDVALLYRHDAFVPLEHENINIFFPSDATLVTRDILFVKGILHGSDTLCLFINHWPSRYGGYLASAPRREAVSMILRTFIDSVMESSARANIMVMGDFNDEISDRSLVQLTSKGVGESYLKEMVAAREGSGTIKYRGVWSVFDQILVSQSLLNGTGGLVVSPAAGCIYTASFLLENDEKYYGYMPYRTYLGFRYHGGFSDHLPVYIDLQKTDVKR